jgi:uncharacterized metal-binding protein
MKCEDPACAYCPASVRACRQGENSHGCEFNVVMGLCIGDDSLFFRYAKGLTTVLVAKDRVLVHNPLAALQLADSYYSRVWGPNRPAKRPTLLAAGRRSK